MSKTAGQMPPQGGDPRDTPPAGVTSEAADPSGGSTQTSSAGNGSSLRVAPDATKPEPARRPVTGAPDERDPIVQISNGIVGLHKRYRGRGPSKVRVHWDGDLVTVLLRGDLSTVEKVLAQEGHWQEVADQRSAYEKVVAPEIIEIIESATGRAVEAFMHAGSHDPDVFVETFVLAPC